MIASFPKGQELGQRARNKATKSSCYPPRLHFPPYHYTKKVRSGCQKRGIFDKISFSEVRNSVCTSQVQITQDEA